MKQIPCIVCLVLTLIMICSLSLITQAATERDFGVGSLIIPRDHIYQPTDDGGFLESFGLVYNLLKHVDPNTGYHDITIYWVLKPNKTSLTDVDLNITNLALKKNDGEAVVFLYNHDGTKGEVDFNPPDDEKRINYTGAPFIVDKADAEKAKKIIDGTLCFRDVDVHIAGTQFKAMVHREMLGTPPQIALMNNKEDTANGNAKILESYLRLANICGDSYDILTPNQIRDGILLTANYEFLWAPHWEGYKNYAVDADGDGSSDVDEIVRQISNFVRAGKGLLAECASIETFEHNKYGRFLTTKGIGHNGGDMDTVVYTDTSSLNVQIGGDYFDPQGGHIHNWRPFQKGDPYELEDAPDVFPAGAPEVTADNPSEYVDTVTQFTTDGNGWDFYVAGHAYGDYDFGYVVYLGGHAYAKCDKSAELNPLREIHTIELEFKEDITIDDITMDVSYNLGSTSITFNKDSITNAPPKTGGPLEIDFSTAKVDKKKIKDISFKNTGVNDIVINSFTFTFNQAALKFLKKIKDTETGDDIYKRDNEAYSGVVLPVPDAEEMNNIIIEGANTENAMCQDNSDCDIKNIGGTQYVLLTLFDIKAQIVSHEFVHSAPIVAHPYLYQGCFEFPSYQGHFRRYDVTNALQIAQWDTADHIPEAKDNNSSSDARQVYTAEQVDSNSWSKIDFDQSNIAKLRSALDITPNDGDDFDEIKVINRIRGKTWNISTNQYTESINKLGGIRHSAPVIIDSKANDSRFCQRQEIAYVGDLHGMFHAVETSTGTELWSFIPRNLLGKLKNERTPNEALNFASVDSSPTAKDIYYDHDNDSQKEWRTIIVCPEGEGGKYVFALDVTDPNDWFPMWEITDPAMGHAFRCAINKIKVPQKNDEGQITGFTTKWLVFVATGYTDIVENYGGINIFAFDLATGDKYWHFAQRYTNSINDIPGAVTLFDDNGDACMDYVYVGDMNGRLWEINALDGTNPHGTETIVDASGDSVVMEIPLYNTGSDYPISVSPAIIRNRKNHTVLVFGTGGSDWASDMLRYAVYAVDATEQASTKTYATGAGTLLWKMDLAVGEKVWSSPTIVGGKVYVATSTGTMESIDMRSNLIGSGTLYLINMDNHNDYCSLNIGKARGSIFVQKKHIYVSTIDNKIIQIGSDNDFSESGASGVFVKAWRLVD